MIGLRLNAAWLGMCQIIRGDGYWTYLDDEVLMEIGG